MWRISRLVVVAVVVVAADVLNSGKSSGVQRKFEEEKSSGGQEDSSFKAGRNKTGQLVPFTSLLRGEVWTEIHNSATRGKFVFLVVNTNS